MREIRYYEAEDGTRFEYEDDCIIYENELIFNEMRENNKIMILKRDLSVIEEIGDLHYWYCIFAKDSETMDIINDVMGALDLYTPFIKDNEEYKVKENCYCVLDDRIFNTSDEMIGGQEFLEIFTYAKKIEEIANKFSEE